MVNGQEEQTTHTSLYLALLEKLQFRTVLQIAYKLWLEYNLKKTFPLNRFSYNTFISNPILKRAFVGKDFKVHLGYNKNMERNVRSQISAQHISFSKIIAVYFRSVR